MGGGRDTVSTISADLAQLIFGHLDPRFFSSVARLSRAFRSAARRGVTHHAMEWQARVERVLTTVSKNGWALLRVPENLRTEKVCLVAVKQYGWALRDVPEHLRTKKVCLEAVKRDGGALQHAPKQLLRSTEKVCLEAVKQKGWALQHVPEHLRGTKVCLVAVKQYGWALRDVPEHLRTEKMCLAAVKHCGQYGGVIQYVPAALRELIMRQI